MNGIRKIVFIFLAMMMMSTSVFALEVCEMSDEYQRWLNLSDELKNDYDIPPYCKELYTKNEESFEVKGSNKYRNLFSNILSNLDSASVTSSRYSALDDGLITPAKDQFGTNSCWAFSGISLVETSALKEGLGVLDLSERHIEYSMTRNAFTDGVKSDGLNRELDAGGNPYFSSSYFFRHDGPILESSMPFEKTNKKISKNNFPTTKAVLDVSEYTTNYYNISNGCDSNQIKTIKEKV